MVTDYNNSRCSTLNNSDKFVYWRQIQTIMSIIKIKDTKVKTAALVTSALYVVACTIFFMTHFTVYGHSVIPPQTVITIPVALLAVSSLWLCPWQISLALAFCAAGDFAGACGNLIGQMGLFAVGHIWFIIYFICRYLNRVEKDRNLTGKAKGYIAMVAFCSLALLAAVFYRIVPAAEAGLLRIATGTYACIICAMLFIAMLQRSTLFALGAILFVFSDFIIAWNMFVSAVPCSTAIIMSTYYIAQWLLYIRSTSFRVGPEMRLMRF